MQEPFERPLPFELADKLEIERDLTDEELESVIFVIIRALMNILPVRPEPYAKSIMAKMFICAG